MNRFLFVAIILIFITSCRTQQDVLYIKNINDFVIGQDVYESPKIQSGDVLTIVVSAFDEEIASPFNLGGATSNAMLRGGNADMSPTSYLVTSEGLIDYPMLGKIEAAGKSRQELSDELTKKISEYIDNPIVNIRILNFRVTMLGEVNQPGIIESPSEKLNIFEAIARAGDLSYYAIRDSVLLIRTLEGERKHEFVNLQDAEIMNSEYYYLRQNDIVYVLPTKSKAMELNTEPLTATLTVIGFITAMIALFK